MPKFITIQADPATLGAVSAVPNARILGQTAKQVGANTWTVDAIVDDAAQAAIVATGAQVVHEESAADVAQQAALAFADISNTPLDLGTA